MTLWYDDTHEVYVLVSTPAAEPLVLATFRRGKPPSGPTPAPLTPAGIAATVLLALSTPSLLFGLPRMLWALRPASTERGPGYPSGTALLLLTLALSVLAAALSRWA